MAGLASNSWTPDSSDVLSPHWVYYIFQCVLSPSALCLFPVSPQHCFHAVKAYLSQCRLKMVGISAASFQLSYRQNPSLWLLKRKLLIKWEKCQKKIIPFLKICMLRAVLRWLRNRMGRPLSPLQIHQKIIWILSNFHKTTSNCWQRTPGTQQGSAFSSKWGTTKYKRQKERQELRIDTCPWEGVVKEKFPNTRKPSH